jgi:protein arginine N-methyltransferase 1
MTGTSYTPHHLLLRDEVRTNAFRRAINATIRKGDIAIDLGAGTGLLSIFAAKSGAKKVYAIERDEQLCTIIEELAAANSVDDVVEVICGDSDLVSLPELADVLICDAMGFFGISYEMKSFFNARKNLVREDARLIPEAVEMWAAPIRADDVYEYLDIGRNNNYGLNLTTLGCISLSSIHSIMSDESNIVARPVLLRTFDMNVSNSVRVAFDAEWDVTSDGPVHGLLGWYRARLSKAVSLSSGPWQPRPMGRARLLPFHEAIMMKEGESLKAGADISPTLAFWWANKGGEVDPKRVEYTTLGSHPHWRNLSEPPSMTQEFIDECHTLLEKYVNGERVDDRLDNWSDVQRIIWGLHKDLYSGSFTGIEKL